MVHGTLMCDQCHIKEARGIDSCSMIVKTKETVYSKVFCSTKCRTQWIKDNLDEDYKDETNTNKDVSETTS